LLKTIAAVTLLVRSLGGFISLPPREILLSVIFRM